MQHIKAKVLTKSERKSECKYNVLTRKHMVDSTLPFLCGIYFMICLDFTEKYDFDLIVILLIFDN